MICSISFSVPVFEQLPFRAIPTVIETVLSHRPTNGVMGFVPVGLVRVPSSEPSRPFSNTFQTSSILIVIIHYLEGSIVVIARFEIRKWIRVATKFQYILHLLGGVWQVVLYVNDHHPVSVWPSLCCCCCCA